MSSMPGRQFRAQAMFDASDWNAIHRPSEEIAGLRLAPLAVPPPLARLTSVTAPLSTSYRKTSDDRFRSRAARLVATDAKATVRPSALMTGDMLASFGGSAAPPTSVVCPVRVSRR